MRNLAIYIFVAVLVASLPVPDAYPLEGDKLVFVLSTDIHSQLYPSIGGNGLVGGLAVLSGVVSDLRSRYGKDAVIWIDRGDAIIGDPIVDMNYGLPVIEAFNLIGLDVMIIDNHELDFGLESLLRMEKYADFPMVTANVFYINGAPILSRYVIIERKGIRIGVTGATTYSPNIIHTDLVNVTSTKRELPNLEHSVARLTSLGVDMIVVITHVSINSIRPLVRKYPLIKLVYKVGSDIMEDDGVLYVGGKGSSKWVAVATFEISQDGVKPILDESTIINVRSPPYPVDSRVLELADYYCSPLNYFLDMPVTILDEGLGRDELCSLMAEALRNFTESDFGLYNKGGVRDVLGSGLVTRYDVYRVFPWWQEGIYVVYVPGWYIKEVAQRKAYSVYPSNDVDNIIDERYYSIAITAYHFVGGDGLLFRKYLVNYTYMDVPYAEAFITMLSDGNESRYRVLLAELSKVKEDYRGMLIKATALESELSSERTRNKQLWEEVRGLEDSLSTFRWYGEVYTLVMLIEAIIIFSLIIYHYMVQKRF